LYYVVRKEVTEKSKNGEEDERFSSKQRRKQHDWAASRGRLRYTIPGNYGTCSVTPQKST